MLSRYCMIYSQEDDPESVILFSTKRASTIVIPGSMIRDIEEGKITEEEKSILFELGFLTESEDGEKEEMLSFIDGLNSMDFVFAAKVAMNLDCNLACRYCFEGQRKGKFYMSKETADSFVEFVRGRVNAESGSFEEIRLAFYGGEPLLSIELVEYISEKMKLLAESDGRTYRGSIITNGTLLTPRVAKRLVAKGINDAAVTLDGPKDVHDYFRPFKTGKGSFDVIIKNLDAVCGIMDIQVGGNYTKENYRDFPLLLDYMMERGLRGDRLSLVRFGPVTKESEGIALPDFREGCDSFNEPWLLEADVFLREEILKRGYRAHRLLPQACSFDMKDHILVNYDGSIYKCPGLIGRTELKVGDLKTGVMDYRQSHYLDNWKNEECLNCCYLPLCFGGCRYMKLVREGTMEGVDCRKPYFDVTLEAFVRQDIRYGGQGRGFVKSR